MPLLQDYPRIVVEKHRALQFTKKLMQEFPGILVILTLFGTQACWSDDIDSFDALGNDPVRIFDEQTAVDKIIATKKRFATLKARGTVWLKTQKAMDQLETLERQGNVAEALERAREIAHDCDLVNNQLALEQARHLLSTLESKGFDDAALETLRAQLKAADGAASFAVAEALRRELEAGTAPNSK